METSIILPSMIFAEQRAKIAEMEAEMKELETEIKSQNERLEAEKAQNTEFEAQSVQFKAKMEAENRYLRKLLADHNIEVNYVPEEETQEETEDSQNQ